MTQIEEKRIKYLSEKYAGNDKYSKEKIEFLVRTGLTFDPNAKKKLVSGEEKAYKDIDWYYPKGAAFDDNISDSSDSSDYISDDSSDYISDDSSDYISDDSSDYISDDSSDSSDSEMTPEQNIINTLSNAINNDNVEFSGDNDDNDSTPSRVDVITIQDENGDQSLLGSSDGKILETTD